MPRIPLIENLTTGPVPAGSNILVEYDATSQWYNATITIAAGWLRTAGRVWYGAGGQPPDSVRSQFGRLGLDAEEFERNDKLAIDDWYAATLGQKSKEKGAIGSLKIADLSLWLADVMRGPPDPDILVMDDDRSFLARFNDEKAWVEFELTRAIPAQRVGKRTAIRGIMRGVDSDSAYRKLEAANDGVVEFKLEEAGRGVRNFIRVRSMRNVGYNSEWHSLKVGKNFEVLLD